MDVAGLTEHVFQVFLRWGDVFLDGVTGKLVLDYSCLVRQWLEASVISKCLWLGLFSV